MTLPFDHTHDLGVSGSEFEIALSQEWDGRLTWKEKNGSHLFMIMILTKVGWADVRDSDRGDFGYWRAVNISSYNYDQFRGRHQQVTGMRVFRISGFFRAQKILKSSQIMQNFHILNKNMIKIVP